MHHAANLSFLSSKNSYSHDFHFHQQATIRWSIHPNESGSLGSKISWTLNVFCGTLSLIFIPPQTICLCLLVSFEGRRGLSLGSPESRTWTKDLRCTTLLGHITQNEGYGLQKQQRVKENARMLIKLVVAKFNLLFDVARPSSEKTYNCFSGQSVLREKGKIIHRLLPPMGQIFISWGC